MITKLLIANRGEIACRIIRTARKMGIRTVAVYSDADHRALHVEMADEAVRIGPAPASESYLVGAAILAAAKATGADAIHPGYGFLSENPDFVEAVEKAGLIFVGPPASAIRAMGLKDAAKALMEKAKVPVVPGYHGEAQELVILAGKANEIGFPVLIKARAGGGGKGMRKVDNQADFPAALSAARREAKASFGDDRVLVEKYVTHPRHVEIQVFADGHGNAVHLFERDCSAQRRHQKVIEEAPAPGMPEDVRRAMGEAAVAAAKAIGYRGAGTVEFIADGSEGLQPGKFWFMEMNTRLQVEHPVTEMITGLDLVEWQIRVARGEKLPLAQDDLTITGHAFEARLYAEDAAKGFLPATGRLSRLAFPDGARIDSGVRDGDAITPFYDPMIAKVITHAPTRAEALDKLAATLEHTEIAGLVTNRAFLVRLCRNADFASGHVDTGLIERHAETLCADQPVSGFAAAVAALLASGMAGPLEGGGPAGAIGPFAVWGAPERRVTFAKGSEETDWTFARTGLADWRVHGPQGVVALGDLVLSGDGSVRATADDVRRVVRVFQEGDTVTVFEGLASLTLRRVRRLGASGHAAAGGDAVLSPMPGIVKDVLVRIGDTVAAGQPVAIMEAMKMEMTLSAPRDGIIAETPVLAGAQVADGVAIILLEAEKAA